MINNMLIIIVVAACVVGSSAVPKKYEEQKNTYPDNDWRRSFNKETNDTQSDGSDRTQRLGFTTGYGNGVQGYGNTGSGVGVYSPMKIDLGGVVIGTLVGIGALLILPKIVSAFSGGHNYYRSADGETGITEMLSKLDDYLGQNNIDSAACMQRAVCNYVKSSEFHMSVGTADQIESMVHSLSGNSLVDYIIDGTAIKEAVENGKNPNGRDCDAIYLACPLDKQSAMQLLTKMLPKRNP